MAGATGCGGGAGIGTPGSTDPKVVAAQDAEAKSLLRKAAIAMESAYVDLHYGTSTPDFASALSRASDRESDITLQEGMGAARSNQVQVIVGSVGASAVADSYVLNTRSTSGAYFSYARDAVSQVLRCRTPTSAASPALTVVVFAATGTCGPGNATW